MSDPDQPPGDPPDSTPPKPRRPRYRGTHPRRFEERYKELDPDRFQAEGEKIRSQGRTPAGGHVPVLVDETLASLQLRPGARGFDATLGYGGHAEAILRSIGPTGFLWAFDCDDVERPKTAARLERAGFANVETVAADFRFAERELRRRGVGRLDFAMADLGVSSMQLDDPGRGFSKKLSGPLDLRLNQAGGETAAEWLARAGSAEVARVLRENSDEPRAERIAEALTAAGRRRPIATTAELAAIIRRTVTAWPRSVREKEGDRPVTRVFQALRIEVNDEFGALDRLLSDLPGLLKPGGRVAFLSFHSGEDRRVKKAFQAGLRAGVWHECASDPVRPSREEQKANPRSSSAKLRWAIRA